MKPRTSHGPLATTALFACIVATAFAPGSPAAGAPRQPPSGLQPPKQPSKPGADPAVDRTIGDLERASTGRRPIEPVSSPSPAASAGLARTPAQSRLVPQGTFLPSRRGKLISAGSQSVFVFEAAPPGQGVPPMIVLPNEFLASMERHIQERGPDAVFTVGGQVYAYHDHNYLLITTRPVADAPPGAKNTEADKPSTQPPTGEAAGRITDPAVEKILAELREAGGGRRTAEPLPAPPRPARPDDAAPKRTVLPEGTFLAGRRGRTVKSPGGEWTFVVDADAAGNSDPPMTIMPCQNLANLERTAELRGESVTFTISGQVFVYHERNFLLPTMFVANRHTDEVVPTQ